MGDPAEKAMNKPDIAQLEAVFLEAFANAVKQVGMGTFKATSMFASNERAVSLKKAA